ncbi:hypothetical protein QBC37DRAFT_429270 [Rhypophila decipiens]|uniref:Uncharacterized protein n=1 Tax=Rhypophila decipiens TaxID=261697 RepID=A0AAN6Y0R8_9PEZI|nr:hypothetical protein QBC37DRAFT_429270 [Rhypophila decipiens]
MADQDIGKKYLVRNFIESRAATIHPVFGVPAHFDMSSSTYGLRSVHVLQETIDKVKENEKSLPLDFDVRNCTWETVLAELERAQEDDEKRGKKWHHKAWRITGSAVPLFGPGLSAFPDELCVLHGGLAVIFSIARHRAQHRAKILAAFEDIPRAIMMARKKAQAFPRDKTNCDTVRLHDSIDDLTLTLLEVLPELIKILNPDTFVSRATSSLKGDKIDDFLERIARSSRHTRDCADILIDFTIKDIHKTVNDHHQVSQNIYADTRNTVTSVDDLRGQVGELLRRQQSLQDTLDAISGKNGLFQFVVELLNNPQLNITSPPPEYSPGVAGLSPRDALMSSPAREATAESVLTAMELLNLLEVQLLGPIEEETQYLYRGRSIDNALLSRAAYMLQTPQVRHLLSAPSAGVVLVDSCNSIADRSLLGSSLTPVSFICATLTQALRRQSAPSPVVLVFFCGSHVTYKDALRGPLGLVRSLLAQLVLELLKNRWVSEEDPMTGVSLPDEPDEDGSGGGVYLADLCGLFHSLLRLIPQGTSVYCIVDGISCYHDRAEDDQEEEEWSEDYAVVMETFAGITADESSEACWFKLLLTSLSSMGPESERGLDRWMKPHQYQRVSMRSGRTGAGTVQRSMRAAGLRDVDMQ